MSGTSCSQRMWRTRRVVLVAFVLAVLATPHVAGAGRQEGVSAANVAFIHVNVVPMDRERVVADQTVLVGGDRIVAIGPAGDVPVPPGATIIDGSGRYLLPGLIDAHVHITTDMPWAPVRSDFGDAPLYLAYGITTIVNLQGTPTQLDWRRRILEGELLGPTIYTSGEHVNEPRVNTPGEARQEVAAQARTGYDLIKFHEIWNPATHERTTRGLSYRTYRELNTAAREFGIPIVGHAPVNLGFDALLESGQALAHLHQLFPVYFLPMASSRGILLANAAGLLILVATRLAWTAGRGLGRRPSWLATPFRVKRLAGWLLAGGLIALVVQLDEYFRSSLPRPALLAVFSALALFVGMLTGALLVATIALWRDATTSTAVRLNTALVAAAGLALSASLVLFWVPAAWRVTDRGIDRLSRQLRDAGIAVQTTLVVVDLAGQDRRGWTSRKQDPAIDHLAPDTRRRWRRLPPPPVVRKHDSVMTRKITAALHRAGVLLVAGSDAMGRPLIPPGSSFHRELALLEESGLTPYEVLRTATINSAIFLRRDREFGTIATGMRADLLLVETDPLEDLRSLQRPVGVMVRGQWFTRERLQGLLRELASSPSNATGKTPPAQ